MILALYLISISLYYCRLSYIIFLLLQIELIQQTPFCFHYTWLKKALVVITEIFIIISNLLLLIFHIYGQDNIIILGSFFLNHLGNALQWQ